MPEIPNVIAGEVIESEWGNDIRDRTVQRYANAAERTSLHGSPVDGDVSFLEDIGQVAIYFSGVWRVLSNPEIGMDGTIDNADQTGSGLFQSAAAITFTKPAHWVSCRILAWGTIHCLTVSSGPPPRIGARINIGGDLGTAVQVFGSSAGTVSIPLAASPVHHRAGITGASPGISLDWEQIVGAVTKDSASLHYIAVRTG